MKVLSPDYSKIAMLQADRTIELHAQYGRHFKIRIPHFGTDMVRLGNDDCHEHFSSLIFLSSFTL